MTCTWKDDVTRDRDVYQERHGDVEHTGARLLRPLDYKVMYNAELHSDVSEATHSTISLT